nr:hypothetical protein [Tatlockia sp.]
MSKSKIDNGLEILNNICAGTSVGALGNLIVNEVRKKPLRVYPGALMGGLLAFGITKVA